jgi:serine/threonine protein kinase
MIAPGTIVGGRYRVVRALGGGGMKLVYLAEDLRLAGRSCALAEMVDSITSPELQQQAVAAFQREADMLAQLANEHIPRIFDRFSEANRHYLVMEYIDGQTLEDELRSNGGKLPPARVIEIARQILTTLEYLHNLDPPVIYRDLKPSNMMVTRDGMAKLIDFGIARHFAPLSNATMIGTQGYAPPEQYRGRVETRSDLYALGATMHHALSGRDPAAEPPFSFPPLRKLCPDLDSSLAALVDQALAYDVVNRTRDATEFKRRLSEIASGEVQPPASTTANNRTGARPQLPLPLGKSAESADKGEGSAQADSLAQAGRPSTAASSAARGSSSQGRPATPAQATPQGASAPTVLSVATEIKCPSCARMIPAESRFCSYCAADLRHTLNAFEMGSSADAETTILNRGHSQSTHGGRRDRLREESGGRRSHRRLRHPFLIVVAIFVISFIVRTIILNSSVPASPPPYDSGSSVPPSNDLRDARLSTLRQALDDAGYENVQFRMNGDVLELSGTVPSEPDRDIVEVLATRATGGLPLRDNMRVHDVFADP